MGYGRMRATHAAMISTRSHRASRALRRARSAALGALLIALVAGCAAPRRSGAPRPEPDPHALSARSDSRLRSGALDVSLRYHEGGGRRFPFALIRLTNRTRAPIYPLLDRIVMIREGAEPRTLAPACDRERRPFARLAPREALWCGDVANPGQSIDVPLALFEIPVPGERLSFVLVVPVIFDDGDPVEVRFANRVDRDDWKLALAAVPAQRPAPSGATEAAGTLPGEPGAP